MDSDKISPALRARLAQLAPAHQIRALVLLTTHDVTLPTTDDISGDYADAPTTTTAALSSLDAALAATAGQRLSAQANALGFVTVTTNTAGLQALAALPHVTAIMENQKITR